MFGGLSGALGQTRSAAEAARVLGLRLDEITQEVASAVPLFANATAQVLVTGCALAAWECLREVLPEPVAVLGYSVGELAAHAIAGTCEPAAALNLAAIRARLMDGCACEPQSMLALPACDGNHLAQLLEAYPLEIAIRNGPGHVVLGGLATDADGAEAWLQSRHVEFRRLSVAVASHTSRLAGAVMPFRQALEAEALKRPRRTVLAGIDASPVCSADQAAEVLSRQIAEPLEWHRCLEAARERGVTVFLELGPGRAMSRMVTEAIPDVEARSVEDFRSAAGVARWVARVCR
jgi:[acyl-carrier-protein] S-malonyltransferase